MRIELNKAIVYEKTNTGRGFAMVTSPLDAQNLYPYRRITLTTEDIGCVSEEINFVYDDSEKTFVRKPYCIVHWQSELFRIDETYDNLIKIINQKG